MNDLVKMLLVAGLLLILAALFIWATGGKSWFGKLPGDISYSRGNFKLYFPLTTCLLLSLLFSLLLWIFRR